MAEALRQLRQLNNTDHYTKCDTDTTHSFAKEISDTLVKNHNCNGINKDTFSYLIPQDPRTARFYLLPKIHKAGNLGRPIASGNGNPTERISEFVDSYLNPLVSHIPSYIQDTADFLRKLEGIKHQNIFCLPFLVTLDVSSLYTNIPHGEGINACAIALRSNNQTKPSVRHLTDLIRHILTKNNFMFLDTNFLQVQGTAMGTKMAPSYANLFISDLEDRLLSSAPYRPLTIVFDPYKFSCCMISI